jgi:DNA polymerase-4
MCPELQCVTAKHDLYVSYHHKIIDEIIKHIPINKEHSIDELSSCLPPRLRNKEAAVEISQNIKEGIWKNVGRYINCSIGIAPNSFLAKIATNLQKPNGLIILEPASLPGPLLQLELLDLPGINKRMELRLNQCGIFTVEQFWNLSPKHARQVWRSVEGERFWYKLHGYEVPDLKTNTSVIGHSRVMDPELRAPNKSRLVARRLTIKAATRLRRKKLFSTRYSISIRDGNNTSWHGDIKLSPTQDNFIFLQSLDAIWLEMLARLRPYKIKKVSITLHGLCHSYDITPDLFDTSSENHQALSQDRSLLNNAIDSLNKKYGAETVQIGISPKTKTGYVGTKISFTRIPDLSEFSE